MGAVLKSLGESGKALTYYQQALAMYRKLYPKERFKDGHPDLATSLNNMGAVLESLRQAGKALIYYEQALAMRQKLYPKERFPDGHPDLVESLNNMGYVLKSLGESGKALTLLRASPGHVPEAVPQGTLPGRPSRTGRMPQQHGLCPRVVRRSGARR